MNETEYAAGVRVRAVLPLYAGAVVFFSLALYAGARFFAFAAAFLYICGCFCANGHRDGAASATFSPYEPL